MGATYYSRLRGLCIAPMPPNKALPVTHDDTGGVPYALLHIHVSVSGAPPTTATWGTAWPFPGAQGAVISGHRQVVARRDCARGRQEQQLEEQAQNDGS